jgi:hypothetical protein
MLKFVVIQESSLAGMYVCTKYVEDLQIDSWRGFVNRPDQALYSICRILPRIFDFTKVKLGTFCSIDWVNMMLDDFQVIVPN